MLAVTSDNVACVGRFGTFVYLIIGFVVGDLQRGRGGNLDAHPLQIPST